MKQNIILKEHTPKNLFKFYKPIRNKTDWVIKIKQETQTGIV